MSDRDYNDEPDGMAAQAKAEYDNHLHDWRISLDERLGMTDTRRLYELLGRVVAVDRAIRDRERDEGYFMDDAAVSVMLRVGDVRLAKELLR